ncbi:MAG: DUF4136 domain-containing protein [Gammaproteobacteria bacterium]
MNIFKRTISVLFVGFFVSACATTPTKDIHVDAEAAPMFALSDYSTYGWLGSAQIIYDPEGKWEPPNVDLDAEFQRLIDRELHKRGMTQVARRPDLIVAYIAGVDTSALELKEDPKEKISMLQNIPKGGLVILLIDGRTAAVVWAGAAVGDVQQQPSVDVVRKRLDYAVSKIFKRLPKHPAQTGYSDAY